jgi:hypothetical protein
MKTPLTALSISIFNPRRFLEDRLVAIINSNLICKGCVTAWQPMLAVLTHKTVATSMAADKRKLNKALGADITKLE